MKRLLLTRLGALLLGAAPAHAATFQVNTTVDSAVCNAITCSLRGACRGRAWATARPRTT